jgi:hypothetical protein
MASDDKRQTIKRGDNTVGTRYALVHNQTTDTYEVWVRKANYNGRVRGGIEYSWRYVQLDMDQPTAEALYAKRLAGKTK